MIIINPYIFGSQVPVNTGVPTYEDTSTITASATGVSAGGNVSVNCPTTVNQYNILIAVISTNGASGGFTPPSGWTQIVSTSVTNWSRAIFWKRAVGTEGNTSITFTVTNAITATAGYSAVVHRFSGCTNTGTPYSALSSGGGTTVQSVTVPSVNVITDRLAVVVYAEGDDTAVTKTGAAEFTEQNNQSTTVGTDYRHALYTTNTTGNTNTITLTTGSYEYASWSIFILNP